MEKELLGEVRELLEALKWGQEGIYEHRFRRVAEAVEDRLLYLARHPEHAGT